MGRITMALKITQEMLTPEEERQRIAETEIPKEGKILIKLINENMGCQVKHWEVVQIRRKNNRKGLGVMWLM